MAGAFDDDETPLLLLHPAPSERARAAVRPLDPWAADDLPRRGGPADPGETDRLRPATAGLLAGLVAGAAALGVAHALVPALLVGRVAAVAHARQITHEAALAIAYAAAAASGALVGALFAAVTRYLRRWLPLTVWALLVFESGAILVLARWPRLAPLAPTILAAVAAYAVVASLALPIRRR